MSLSLLIGKRTRESDLMEEQSNAYLLEAVFMNIIKTLKKTNSLYSSNSSLENIAFGST